MNRHFQAYNALPCAPLGEPKGTEKQQASDGEWKPLRPGYESRTLAGGATEVRSTPDSLEEMVTRPDESPASQSREPAYQPEGFGYAHVDHRGHQGDAIPKRTELDPGRVMPEDVHGSCLKPAPVDPLDDLAERVANDSGMYRRLIEHRGGCRCCVSPPCSACVEPLTAAEAEALGWLDEETAAPPVVKRVAKPAAADVPEGATHVQVLGASGEPLFSRHLVGCMFYRAGPDGRADNCIGPDGTWQSSGWRNEELDGPHFKRLPQSAAPTEWQSGPPPEKGWWPTTEGTARHFDGVLWSLDTFIDRATATQRRNLMRHTALADQWSIRWRGPRLVGADWPEPQQ